MRVLIIVLATTTLLCCSKQSNKSSLDYYDGWNNRITDLQVQMQVIRDLLVTRASEYSIESADDILLWIDSVRLDYLDYTNFILALGDPSDTESGDSFDNKLKSAEREVSRDLERRRQRDAVAKRLANYNMLITIFKFTTMGCSADAKPLVETFVSYASQIDTLNKAMFILQDSLSASRIN